MGSTTKSKISVTLSSPLGCEQGSHMWFSPCCGERHGCNFKTRLVIEKDPNGRAVLFHRTVSKTIYYKESSITVNDTEISDSFSFMRLTRESGVLLSDTTRSVEYKLCYIYKYQSQTYKTFNLYKFTSNIQRSIMRKKLLNIDKII